MKLEGKTALITGGAKRIGREIAISLAREGVNLIIHYSSSETDARQTKEECGKFGVGVEIVKADLNSPEGIDRLLNEVGKADILINNASVFRRIMPEDITLGSIEESIRVNFSSHFLLTKKMWEEKRRRMEEGHVINLLDAKRVRKNYIPYHFGKVLLQYLTEEMFYLFSPTLRINGVALGLILPPEGEGEEYLVRLSENVPMRKYGNPKDVSSAVLFLLKSDFITGEVIYISGGEK